MKKIGPWQHCDSCGKNQSHEWIADLTYSCSVCHRETKALPYITKNRRVGSEYQVNIMEVLTAASVTELKEILDTAIKQTTSPGLNWANGLRQWNNGK